MNIIEAIKEAQQKEKYIIRKDFVGYHKIDVCNPFDLVGLDWNGKKINEKGPSIWNPSPDDLLADDWLVVD